MFLEFQVIEEHTSRKPEELTIRKGDVIQNVQYVMNGWNKGTVKDQCGMFADCLVTINTEKVSAELLSYIGRMVEYVNENFIKVISTCCYKTCS